MLPEGENDDDDDDDDDDGDSSAAGNDATSEARDKAMRESVCMSMMANPYFVVPGLEDEMEEVPAAAPPSAKDLAPRGGGITALPEASWLQGELRAALDEEYVSPAEMRRRRTYAQDAFAVLSPKGMNAKEMRKREQTRRKVAKNPTRYFAKFLSAVEKGAQARAVMLLACGVVTTQQLPSGWTALHTAAACNRAAILKIMLNIGNTILYIDAATTDGMTPLHIAARDNAPAAVRTLLDHGASILPDAQGRLPHDIAIEHRCGGALEVLHNATCVFGRELTSSVARDHSHVPSILRDLMMTLLESPNALTTEGVFRKSARKASLDILRALYDRGYGEVDLTKLLSELGDVTHTCAHAMKLFFVELPTPLVPPAFFEAAGQLGQQVISFGLDSEPASWPAQDLDSRATDCRAILAAVSGVILAELPVEHRKVLRALLLFLRFASLPVHSSLSKMGASNLALVMAPNILRSPGIDALTELQMSKPLNALMTFMIIHVQHLAFERQ